MPSGDHGPSWSRTRCCGINAVMHVTGLGRSTIYRLMADRQFPDSRAAEQARRCVAPKRPGAMERGPPCGRALIASAAVPTAASRTEVRGRSAACWSRSGPAPGREVVAMVLPNRAMRASDRADQSDHDDHRNGDACGLRQVRRDSDPARWPHNGVGKREQTPTRPVDGIRQRCARENEPLRSRSTPRQRDGSHDPP